MTISFCRSYKPTGQFSQGVHSFLLYLSVIVIDINVIFIGSYIIYNNAYLSDVLKRLPTHKVTQIEELLPHCWKPKSN
ncbi:Mobile element protein [Acinetobacter lwoffii]|nr:Mobile element protein [Acinetobacter lwoffii]